MVSFAVGLLVLDSNEDGGDVDDSDDDSGSGLSKEAKVIFWGIVVFLLLICVLLTIVICK